MTLSAALQKHVCGNRTDIKENLRRALQSSTCFARKMLVEGLTQLLHEAQEISNLGEHALPLIRRAIEMVDSDSYHQKQFVTLSRQIQELDSLLGEKRLFSEVMIDFQAELVSYQYLQGYKIKRANDPQLILRLSLESIERAFLDFNSLANAVISNLQKI